MKSAGTGSHPPGPRWSLFPILSLAALSCADAVPSGRADIVAEAGTETLAPDRMASWLSRMPATPVRQDVERVALVWLDYTLLGLAVAGGEPLSDSAFVRTVTTPDEVLLVLRAWHDELAARRPPLPADLPDSLYAGDSLRVYQHLLLRISNPQDVRVVTPVRERAESLLVEARGAAEFGALARQHSEEPASANDNGYMPVMRRGMLPPELERAAWRLPPGQVGGYVSRAGFHVVRRPPLEEARPRLAAWADSQRTRVADSITADSLRTSLALRVTDQAVPILRAYFADPASRSGATDPLATWQGGALPLDRLAIWLDMLPPASFVELRGASQLTLEQFVLDIALQEILLAQATAAGHRLQPGQWAALLDAYRRSLRESLALLGVDSAGVSLAPGEVTGRVNALLDGLTADRVRWRPLPSALGSALRERLGYRLHRAGAEAVLQLVGAPSDTLRRLPGDTSSQP